MNLPEMPRWAAKNIGANLAEGASVATIYVVDNLIPRALTAAVATKERAVELAGRAKKSTATLAKTAVDGVFERVPQEQFNLVMDHVIAPPAGFILAAVEAIRSKVPSNNERRIK